MSKFLTIAASAAVLAVGATLFVASTTTSTQAQPRLTSIKSTNMSLIHQIACTAAQKKACKDHCHGSTTGNCAPCAACQ
jgi:hypothetical protein